MGEEHLNVWRNVRALHSVLQRQYVQLHFVLTNLGEADAGLYELHAVHPVVVGCANDVLSYYDFGTFVLGSRDFLCEPISLRARCWYGNCAASRCIRNATDAARSIAIRSYNLAFSAVEVDL